MENEPLNSADQVKVFIFILLFLPMVIYVIGIIPAILLVFGFIMMKKNRDFSSLENSVKLAKVYCLIGVVGGFIGAVYYGAHPDNFYSHDEELIISGIVIAIASFYFIILEFLFLSPLKTHSSWVTENGVFSNKKKQSKVGGFEIDIIKGEKLKQFSVADELIKWAKLKEDGHISEKEFDEARAKLLKKE